MSIKTYLQLTALLALVAIFLGVLFVNRPQTAIGSTIQGNDYSRLNLAGGTAFGATTTVSVLGKGLVKTGQGSLGSVVITGANTGILNFYDATTSNVNKRTGNKATSTILLASIPASLAAGTYTFDIAFYTGLFVSQKGTAPTSTVTFR